MSTVIERGSVQHGRYISDIEEGEDLGAVAFELSPEFVDVYLRGIGESTRALFRDEGLVPPTMMHPSKLRLLTTRFPAGPGPHARMHYHFDCRFHSAARVGERLIVSGVCARRYEKRGRPYIELEVEVHGEDGRLIWNCTDTLLLRLAVNE
jgi:hypothetical protein